MTNANAPAVVEICVRLDGVPLAIELAASRVKLLSRRDILSRLEQRLSLPAATATNLPERQRTLRGGHRLEQRPPGRARAAAAGSDLGVRRRGHRGDGERGR